MAYSEKEEQIRIRYYSRMQKKIEGKPFPVQLIMERTFSSACMILTALDGIPFNELAMGVFFFCKDVQFREVVRQYDAQLELAGANPDKFVFGLHSFYNTVTNRIRKEGRYVEFAEFLATVVRIQTEQRGKVNGKIVDAYLDLILQTLEYMRPNKFALETCVYGVSRSGELLVGPYPYAYSDVPGIELERAMRKGTAPQTKEGLIRYVANAYAKQGIDITSNFNLNQLEQVQRLHINTTTALLPFINEFTWDIVPTKIYNTIVAPLLLLESTSPWGIDELKEKLKHRKRTLPTNGVNFVFEDLTGELKSLLLRELLYSDRIYMLYRIDFGKGSIAGYYDTIDGYVFSVVREATEAIAYENLSLLLLTLYASQVLSPSEGFDLDNYFLQQKELVHIKGFARGGKLRDTYHTAEPKEGTGASRRPEEYDTAERSINGFIRRLPDGQVASEEARALAESYGYELTPGETYVRPFIKSVFIKKKDSQTDN